MGSKAPSIYSLTVKTPIFSPVKGSPAVAGGKVYVGASNKVYCLDAVGNGDGTTNVIWDYTTGDYVLPSPAVADGKVYVGSLDNKIYAFGPPEEPIPTLTEWGLIIFMMVMLGIGVMIIRRRRVA